MKSNSLLVLACLFSTPVLAQSLPDEINHAPYEARFRNLERETAAAHSQLSQSRSELAATQKFIREMTSHISQLEYNIDEAEGEIGRLRREIPELERQIYNLRSEDSQVMNALRGKQNEEANLLSRHQQAQRDLRPLENMLAQKQQRLRELQSELAQAQRAERLSLDKLNQAKAKVERIEKEHAEVHSRISQMKVELQNIQGRISSVQSEISSSESSINHLNNSLRTEQAKLEALNRRVEEYQAELSRLRSSNASPEEIAVAERKLKAATNTHNNTAGEIRNLSAQIKRTEVQVTNLKSQLAELQRNQSALPNRISQSETRLTQLQNERNEAKRDIASLTAESERIRRNVGIWSQRVVVQQNEVRDDQQLVMRHRQFIENLDRQIDAVRNEISNLNSRSRNLNAQIARTSELARSHQAAIPRHEESIRRFQLEISGGQRDLITARAEERNYSAAVSRDESQLREITFRRDNARGEWNKRLSLYNRYLDEAEGLGVSQAGTGTTLGEKEGLRLSSYLSQQNGKAVGTELGLAEAKYWGSVRGEIQGYADGHAAGVVSQEDINRAVRDAASKAAVDAELYAQRNFKPLFFEEFVQEEFKKPLGLKSKDLSIIKSFSRDLGVEFREVVTPLSPNEIAHSNELKTPLDISIKEASLVVKQLESKVERLSDPNIAFEAPTKIPTGVANCSQVYKGIAVFKAQCESAYKSNFAMNYVSAAKTTFDENYSMQFADVFNATNVSRREAAYPSEMAAASKVGYAEGLRVGKIEIYQDTFAIAYASSYKTELEKARNKAKMDASQEFARFLKSNPLLTVASSQLIAEEFRGGEEVVVAGKVKNVSAVMLKGPVVVRVTELVNADKVSGEAVLNSAAGLAVTSLPNLKVKVSPTARAGEKMIVRGIVELPGDLYRPAREEKFELSQVLSANPAHSLDLDYSKSPNIKGMFRRNIHFMNVSLSPTVEDIKDGYKVVLTPSPESSSHLDIRTNSLATGEMSVGTSKDLRISYVFNDSAKGRNIEMELAVYYAGKVIKKEKVSMVPR